MNILTTLLSLFFPDCCFICDNTLVEGEKYICTSCRLKLPVTGYSTQLENNAADRFKGKIPYSKVASFLYYNKGGIAQKIIAHIKYKGHAGFGIFMGELMARNFSDSFFEDIDIIIPIPLHPKKLRKRGYNQAEEIAKGISLVTHIPTHTEWVLRKTQTNTQTQKGRYARWLNTIDVFEAKTIPNLKNKHILIIDDVLTTGATIESCAEAILKHYPEIKISILTLAVTE